MMAETARSVFVAIAICPVFIFSVFAMTQAEDSADMTTDKLIGDCKRPGARPGMCEKKPMRPDGIIRLSRIEVYPEHLEEYVKFAAEVGEMSLRSEPGVLTMYAVAEKERPNIITILETYASQEDYRAHIASPHFQKYKQCTLKMVKDLQLLDQKSLNPANRLENFMVGRPESQPGD